MGSSYPVFVKRPVSTASSGVRRAANAQELAAAAREFGLGQSELIAQSHVSGPLAMVQAIADGGRLVAHHACLRLREGVGGGASLKQSIALPGLADMLARLVASLDWHGALSMDLIVGDSGPVIIDLNPRLVEPANALAAGVDLDIARAARPQEQSSGGTGVRTRQTLLVILGAAEHQGTRGAVVHEAFDAVFARGDYTGPTEELTPRSALTR